MFGDEAVELVAHGRVDAAWKQAAGNAAATLHSRAMHTDIEAALLAATADWNRKDGATRRELIVLTDGIVDVAPSAERSRASRARLLDVQLPRLQRLGAHIHTLALSPEADVSLMARLSSSTGGYHEAVEDAAHIERAFLRIFEASAAPDSLPIAENRFVVDASVTEMTLVLFRDEDASPTRIIEPGGRPLGWERRSEDVRWDHERGYDLITITRPAAGTWAIDATADSDNRALIITDLRLETTKLPPSVAAGSAARVDIELTDGGRRIDSRAILKKTAFAARVNGPAGSSQDIEVDRTDVAGRFSASIPAFAEAGRYEVVVAASAPTFARERRHVVTVTAPAPDTNGADADAAAVSARAKAGKARLLEDGDATAATDVPKAAIDSSRVDAVASEDPRAAHADDGAGERGTAKTAGNTTVAAPDARSTIAGNAARDGDRSDKTQRAKAGAHDTPAAKSATIAGSFGWLAEVAAVIGFNLFLAGIGYYFHRRWRNRPGVAHALEAL
jgi:hypothetical protein